MSESLSGSVLEVTHGALHPSQAVGDPRVDDSAGWRISCLIDGVWHSTVRKPFVSKRDAELALKALHAAGIATAGEALPLGRQRFEGIMYSALPW